MMFRTRDDRTLCACCFNDDERAWNDKLLYEIPDDPENYPLRCEGEDCGYIATGPGSGMFPGDPECPDA